MTDDLDDLIRRVDPDRWLSSRFIGDAERRADVVTLYAFDHELARAPKVASNPLLGEIRLTWWREVLDEVYERRPVRHHPTAQALAGVVVRHGLPRAPLEAMIDGRYRELDATPMGEEETLAWARETAGRAAEVAAQILDATTAAEGALAAGAMWAVSKRTPALVGSLAASARAGVRRLSVPAFPAAAHAALAVRPPATEVGKRLRLTWAVARGRV
jgi:phytoene synthase